ncbi:hypothetical protein LTR91_007223 [Friedmanniomyces endolithicus]|uniref:Transmembrane protein 135 N-terminal domain-containing protein n=1 Tax=Friedmanniomyces endolithicus TaxID=329885 RepID=A0AAN6KS60_9PEZI|nr:hypothetical protein LTR94_016619 [Friedmanniomyces endolithicus]KAK0802594.1 hypothetical protein LTR59_005034 [Friedmanniomyces endolithicus]KAK0812800.1 hypothetical protein LTR75_004746 [Friedmanniomyces endolithicus]KAK0818823.1 hypothetical protein LTR38_000921 [Friedmanniomyces endolithicus]KAK0855426.1 hypothetical protein LTR03_001878 [Friedmanniomyces endolithicus]
MSSPPKKTSSSSGSDFSKRPIDPITRTALRYSLSPREYELLHQYLISRTPQRVQKRAPDPKRYEKITKSKTESGDYNVAAMRDALRVFVVTFVGLKGLEVVTTKLASRRGGAIEPKTKLHKHANARMALSYSTILLFHRLLNRFFRRLRASLLEEHAAPFRSRNPRITQLLTSQHTPAIGASLAGFFLGVSPADQLRMTIAIYLLTRSAEFGYNALESSGYVWAKDADGKPTRPWWFGSRLIMPFACGQLLHAFVFDRDCFPASYGAFIVKRSPEYIQFRPSTYPVGGKAWPGTFDIVDALAELSKLRWPPFVSPILFPSLKQTLPSGLALSKVSPITSSAHPGIKHTSCAVLHPQDPSCARTYLKYWLAAFPSIAKLFTAIYGGFALLGYKSLLKAPTPFLNRLAARILRMAVFLTGAIGTSWASICFFSNYLPRNTLLTQRWFLGGFIGGLWAFVARRNERSNFLYSARVSIDSTYKVGKKRGWWRGVRGGDVMVFVASLAVLNLVYEKDPAAVKGPMVRKALSSLRGEGWMDKLAAAKGITRSDETDETDEADAAPLLDDNKKGA